MLLFLISGDILFKSIALACILLQAVVIVRLLIRQKKLKEGHNEKEEMAFLAEQAKKLKESELENLHLAMQLKEQELIYHTLQSADLKNVNKSIQDKMAAFQFRFQKKRDQEEFSIALAEIGRNVAPDPMGDFELLFKQMHRGFYEKLLERSTQLTKVELQVCALLRLNLSSKDIARLVNLSPASIDVTRSRVRKKLGLDSNANLTNFLIMLG